MLWRRSAHPFVAPPVAAVPDPETLRRAALQASWQRGRWVARRRLLGRWALWVLTRRLTLVLVSLTSALWLLISLLMDIDHPQPQPVQSSGEHPAATAPSSVTVSVTTTSASTVNPSQAESGSPAKERRGSVDALPNAPLDLKLDTRSGATTAPTPSIVTARPDNPYPHHPFSLKPENGLHSKEP